MSLRHPVVGSLKTYVSFAKELPKNICVSFAKELPGKHMSLLQMSSLKTYVSFTKELPKNICVFCKRALCFIRHKKSELTTKCAIHEPSHSTSKRDLYHV